MQKRYLERRNFIANTSKAFLAVGFANSLGNLFAKNYSTSVVNSFSQNQLIYSYGALEKCIDEKTMMIHHSKHAVAYLKNLNEAYVSELGYKKRTLEHILSKVSKYSTKMRNNAGGHFNHEFFWQCLTPNSTEKPTAKLEEFIVRDFGSFEQFKIQFSDAAKQRFGSGWAWLVLDKKGKLQIGSTPNQDNPLMNISTVQGKPLLALDVWEHAYYLKYQNKRTDYINNFWKIVNWQFVEDQLG